MIEILKKEIIEYLFEMKKSELKDIMIYFIQILKNLIVE